MKFRRKLLCLVMVVAAQRAESATLENACQQHRVNADSNNQYSQKALQKRFIKMVSSLTEQQKKDFIGHLEDRSFNSFDEVLNFLDSFLEVDALADLSWGSQMRSLKVNGGLTEEEENFLFIPIEDSVVLQCVQAGVEKEKITISPKSFKILHRFRLSTTTQLSVYKSRPNLIYGKVKVDFKKEEASRIIYDISHIPVAEQYVKEIFNGNYLFNCNPIFSSSDTSQSLAKLIDANQLTIEHVLIAVESRYPDSPLDKQRALRAIFFNNPEVVKQLEDLGIIPEGQGLVGSGVFKERVVSAAVFLQTIFNKFGL